MPKPTCGYSFLFEPSYYKCGEEVWDKSKNGYCIFHEPGKEKDVELFDRGIIQKLGNEDYIFIGYAFPGDTGYFIEHKFEKSARFDFAIFLGDRTSFGGAEFSGEQTDFSGAKFSGERTDFSEALFSGKRTSFSNAKFSGKLTDFSNAQFDSKETCFSHAEFSGQMTNFSFAQFSGERTDFTFAQFSGERTDFSGAEFSGEHTDFTFAHLSGKLADFSGAEFSGERTSFSGAHLSGKLTDFSNAQFSGKLTSFSGAEFSGKLTDFSNAVFSESCLPLFHKTKFHNVVEFKETSFRNGAWFRESRFFGRADFSWADFLNKSFFIEAEFMGQAVIFREVDLSRVFFGDFKLLNRMDLIDIKAWGEKKYYFGVRKRNTCADEVAARNAGDFKAASRTLAALENVAKANHNSALASDFAYGRRECDRRAHPNALIRLLLLIFGAGFFGWGEKLSNIALSSVIVVFILAFAFLFSGIHVKSENINDKQERQINRELSFSWEERGPTAEDYFNCLYFSAVTFTTLGYGDMRAACKASKVLAMAEAFFGAFIIATFAALYLRRLLT